MVNAAGINIPNRRMEVLSQQDWDKLISINLTGAFHCTQAVLSQMREQKNGLIVHITSISGKWGDTSGAAYQASKHGMVGLAYATMFEERLNGIRVTLIFPGLCDTPILKNRPVPMPQEMLDQMMKPEDIAAGCVFVASLPARTYVPRAGADARRAPVRGARRRLGNREFTWTAAAISAPNGAERRFSLRRSVAPVPVCGLARGGMQGQSARGFPPQLRTENDGTVTPTVPDRQTQQRALYLPGVEVVFVDLAQFERKRVLEPVGDFA